MKKEYKKNNAIVESIKEDGFYHIYITLEDGTRVPVRLSFYNRKLQYKIHMVLNNGKE